jgi:glycosyltransferase involved in cell wall biosynthesis
MWEMVRVSPILQPALDAHVVGRRMTGNETYIVNLADALARRSDVAPLAYLDRGTVWPHPGGPTVRNLRWRAPYLRIPVELPWRARRDGADLLHVQYVAPPLARLPVVAAIHDVSFEDVPGLFRRRTELRLKASVRLTVQRSAAIITISEFTRSRIAHHYHVDPARIHVTPLGVGDRWRRMDEDAAAGVLSSLNLPETFVLAVGNLHPRKNIARLVRAVAAARRAGTGDLHLVLAGQRGWRADEVDQAIDLVDGERWVHRLGYIDDSKLLALHTAATAVAYVSLYEGFGLPVLEALACGAVVVASSTTAVPEVTGDAAVLVDPASDDAVTAGLIRATTDAGLRGRLGVAGPARAAAFTWDACASATMAGYRSALVST